MFESRALKSPSLRVQLAKRCEEAKPLLARVGYWLASGRGELTLWVPDDSDPMLLDVLDRGGMSGSSMQVDAQHELCSVVRSFLNRVPSGSVLFECQWDSVTTPWMDRFQGETMRLGEVLFIVVRSASEDEGALLQLLYGGDTLWLDAWFMCRDDSAIDAVRRSNAESPILDEVVASSDEVWFGAFDGDGFVVWSPNAKTVAKPD